MAFNEAIRADTVHESHLGRYLVRQKHYIDAKKLFRTLAQTSGAPKRIRCSPRQTSDVALTDNHPAFYMSGALWLSLSLPLALSLSLAPSLPRSFPRSFAP
jgi:hypothetical protein